MYGLVINEKYTNETVERVFRTKMEKLGEAYSVINRSPYIPGSEARLFTEKEVLPALYFAGKKITEGFDPVLEKIKELKKHP